MAYEASIKAAIIDLESQERPNFRATAKKYGIGRTTLYRRYTHQTTSREEFLSQSIQCLTKEQEEVLVNQINYLSGRGLHPTSCIVKNMAEAIIKKEVGKNWTSGFITRHKDQLLSLYLKNIDNECVKAEYVLMFELFFQLVE